MIPAWYERMNPRERSACVDRRRHRDRVAQPRDLELALWRGGSRTH